MTADFGVETVGEVEGKGTVGEIDNVAFRGINEDFVGEKIQF